VEVEETAQYAHELNAAGQRVFRIMDHDLVIFMGDFNYRIAEVDAAGRSKSAPVRSSALITF